MNVITKYEPAPVKSRISLLISASYFIVNMQKQASHFLHKMQ